MRNEAIDGISTDDDELEIAVFDGIHHAATESEDPAGRFDEVLFSQEKVLKGLESEYDTGSAEPSAEIGDNY